MIQEKKKKSICLRQYYQSMAKLKYSLFGLVIVKKNKSWRVHHLQQLKLILTVIQ